LQFQVSQPDDPARSGDGLGPETTPFAKSPRPDSL